VSETTSETQAKASAIAVTGAAGGAQCQLDAQLVEIDGSASGGGKENAIVNDLNSDSAIGLGTSIARSSRTSPSDFELSESYL